MPVPTSINDLSTTASANYPSGTDTPATLDDVQRAHASFIAKLRDEKMDRAGTVTATANQPMGGFKHTGLAAGSSNGDSVRYEQLFGNSQVWYNELGSRSTGITYPNGSRTMVVSVAAFSSGVSNSTIGAIVNGVTAAVAVAPGSLGGAATLIFVVPPGGFYRVDQLDGAAPTLTSWAEVR